VRSLRWSGATIGALGAIHIVAHFAPPPEEAGPILEQMRQTPIELMGAHTMLQFHLGFSLAMGVMLLAYGVVVALVADPAPRVGVRRIHTLVCAVMTVLSMVYFHPLAWGMCLVAFAISLPGLGQPPSPT